MRSRRILAALGGRANTVPETTSRDEHQQQSASSSTLYTLEQLHIRSNNYDPQWVLDNQTGPNPLWLIEALTEVIDTKPGMRVLGLGCGAALTSIFLAKEFDAQVWATDHWIEASGNQERIRAADVEREVVPIHAGHTLFHSRERSSTPS